MKWPPLTVPPHVIKTARVCLLKHFPRQKNSPKSGHFSPLTALLKQICVKCLQHDI